jgi:hypothetical protein
MTEAHCEGIISQKVVYSGGIIEANTGHPVVL